MPIGYCKKCDSELIIPDFEEYEKLELWKAVFQKMPLIAIQKMIQWKRVSLENAKKIELHINDKYGDCVRCDNNNLKKEYVNCSKCGAHNLNWKINLSFNSHFCDHLEFHLTKELLLFEDKDVSGFWCDGIVPVPNNLREIAVDNISEYRMIKTIAYLGKDGQDIYDLNIFLGNKSLSKFMANETIIDCLPSKKNTDWIDINNEDKTLKLYME